MNWNDPGYPPQVRTPLIYVCRERIGIDRRGGEIIAWVGGGQGDRGQGGAISGYRRSLGRQAGVFRGVQMQACDEFLPASSSSGSTSCGGESILDVSAGACGYMTIVEIVTSTGFSW